MDASFRENRGLLHEMNALIHGMTGPLDARDASDRTNRSLLRERHLRLRGIVASIRRNDGANRCDGVSLGDGGAPFRAGDTGLPGRDAATA
jgi:hypothetical protein